MKMKKRKLSDPAWVTRGECMDCKKVMEAYCERCRNGWCVECKSVCTYCKAKTKTVSAEELWNCIIIPQLERWVNEGWQENDGDEIIKPYEKAYNVAKEILFYYWHIQTTHPSRSFMLPTVTLDVIGRGMFIDFRNLEKKVLTCYCDKDGICTISYNLEQSLENTNKVAILLLSLIHI
jgi:hypothetical protein